MNLRSTVLPPLMLLERYVRTANFFYLLLPSLPTSLSLPPLPSLPPFLTLLSFFPYFPSLLSLLSYTSSLTFLPPSFPYPSSLTLPPSHPPYFPPSLNTHTPMQSLLCSPVDVTVHGTQTPLSLTLSRILLSFHFLRPYSVFCLVLYSFHYLFLSILSFVLFHPSYKCIRGILIRLSVLSF